MPAVIVECLNASNSGHEAKQYDLNSTNSYEIAVVRSGSGKYVRAVTVISAYYAMKYNAAVHYDHAVTVENITYELTSVSYTYRRLPPSDPEFTRMLDA